VSVRQSVCLSHRSTAAVAAGGFAAEVGSKRYQLIAAAAVRHAGRVNFAKEVKHNCVAFGPCTYEEYFGVLYMPVIVQNLVGIDAVVFKIRKFRYFASTVVCRTPGRPTATSRWLLFNVERNYFTAVKLLLYNSSGNRALTRGSRNYTGSIFVV